VVIEVNPRLTTAYLGVRAATAGAANVAGLAIDACRGVLPADSAISHRVRFTAAGTVVSVMPLRGAAPGPGALPFPR
jgi:predicted ATP-grasp superfamily ATP-dependent carboligase